ncbi:MAG: hypothetical protein ACJ8EB_02200 [Allosphingosinicella sp.]
MGAAAGAAALLLAACSVDGDLAAADAAVAGFHADLDRGAFAQIYNAASPEMKAVTNGPDLVRLLALVHARLGAFKRGARIGWNDSRTTSGHFVNLNYRAAYEKGAAEESFVFRLDGGRAALAGYHIDSPAFTAR